MLQPVDLNAFDVLEMLNIADYSAALEQERQNLIQHVEANASPD